MSWRILELTHILKFVQQTKNDWSVTPVSIIIQYLGCQLLKKLYSSRSPLNKLIRREFVACGKDAHKIIFFLEKFQLEISLLTLICFAKVVCTNS